MIERIGSGNIVYFDSSMKLLFMPFVKPRLQVKQPGSAQNMQFRSWPPEGPFTSRQKSINPLYPFGTKTVISQRDTSVTTVTDHFSQLATKNETPCSPRVKGFLQVCHVWMPLAPPPLPPPFCVNEKTVSKLISNNRVTKVASVLARARGFQVVARCRLPSTPTGPEPRRSETRRMMKSPSKEPLRVSRTEGRSVDGRNLTPMDMSSMLPTRGGGCITSLTVQDISEPPLGDYS